MERRSTNPNGYTHFQYDLTAHVGSSHGVRLSGGSTGGIVEAVGDDTNVSLTIRGQGTGAVTLGSSNQSVFLGGSTVQFQGFIRATDTAVATPNFNTTNAMVMETTHAITGLSSQTAGTPQQYFIIATPHNLSTDCALAYCYVGSTATEIHCRFEKHSTVTVGASTATIDFLVIRTAV
jgi:hypothetical protein